MEKEFWEFNAEERKCGDNVGDSSFFLEFPLPPLEFLWMLPGFFCLGRSSAPPWSNLGVGTQENPGLGMLGRALGILREGGDPWEPPEEWEQKISRDLLGVGKSWEKEKTFWEEGDPLWEKENSLWERENPFWEGNPLWRKKKSILRGGKSLLGGGKSFWEKENSF